MRLISDVTGRFPVRPFYEISELDIECEVLVDRFLCELYGEARYPISTDDITKLVERNVDDLDLYSDLASLYGADVEGVTEFHADAKPKVKIAAELSEDIRRENRLRTTLTHELGHVLFHAWLFDPSGKTGQLFSEESVVPTTQVCKRETILNALEVDWMEWQAGHISGALLMPGSVVKEEAKTQLLAIGAPAFRPVVATDPFGSALVRSISGKFQVSTEAARIRLLRLSILQQNHANQ